MADVLLTHSYHLPYDPKQVRKMQPYAPLGTLYAASALRVGNGKSDLTHTRETHLGEKVKVVFVNSHDTRAMHLQSLKNALRRIHQHRIKYGNRNIFGTECGRRIQGADG